MISSFIVILEVFVIFRPSVKVVIVSIASDNREITTISINFSTVIKRVQVLTTSWWWYEVMTDCNDVICIMTLWRRRWEPGAEEGGDQGLDHQVLEGRAPAHDPDHHNYHHNHYDDDDDWWSSYCRWCWLIVAAERAWSWFFRMLMTVVIKIMIMTTY